MNSKIVVFEKAGEPLKILSTEIPALGPGEILVRNEYATLCRSDISTYTGKRIEKSPTILGHEIVGRIAATAPGEQPLDLQGNPLRIGERVTWAIYAADPAGEMARRGIPQKSPDLFKYGHEQLRPDNTLHGGLAEYTFLRRYTPVLPLPEDIPLPEAAIINCAVATVAGSLRLAGEIRGRRVALWGTGMLGVIACAMYREAGAAEVIALDINEARLEQARPFGATSLLRADRVDIATLQADITVDYSGFPGAMEASVSALNIGGTAVWVGGVCPQERVRLDSEQIIRRLVTIKGLHNYNADDFKAAVDFIVAYHHKYPFDRLVYDGFPLERAEEAFRYAIERNPFRVGIRMASNHQPVK